MMVRAAAKDAVVRDGVVPKVNSAAGRRVVASGTLAASGVMSLSLRVLITRVFDSGLRAVQASTLRPLCMCACVCSCCRVP